MSEWRFSTHTSGSHMGEPVTVIQRGRLYRLSDDGDSWRDYWDGDQMIAVYDDQRHYHNPTSGEDTDRVVHAMEMAREYDQDIDAVLKRLAIRLTDHSSYAAEFITVGLERGVTLYAHSWDGDPFNIWRDEIEAVYYGEVYRITYEEYDGQAWQYADDMCDEWYGEDNAQAAFEHEFPLTEFPAELLVVGSE